MSLRRTVRRRRLVPAATLATVVHLMVLLALGWRIPRLSPPPPGAEDTPVQVFILRPPRPVRPPARQRTARTPAPGPAPAAPPAARTPPMLTQPAPAAPPAAALGEDPSFRSALRGLVGCTDPAAYRLSHEERAVCDQHLADAKPAPVGPQFSAEEVAAFNADKQESIFTRKLHNECLPRIGNRPAKAPTGGSSAAATAFGIGCSWSF